ncbi:MAG: response regulator transcription factor [Lachnospiraceae bacterium]|nr:response regulator transcription factor [Lachnospiraceae bacterium]
MLDILIIEDNKELGTLLCDFLRAENYTVSVAGSAEKGLALYEKYGARLVVLDIMLPGADGFSVCARIRRQSDTPILIVSARTQKEDKLTGLELGADDYIEKPYDIDIMLAKIAGIFRRRCSSDEITVQDLQVDRRSRVVRRNGVPVDMTAKEFDLLLLLLENRGRTLDKDFIFRRVWPDSLSEPQTLTVHIKWLRQKIEDDPKRPSKILTVWGVGYRFA